MVSNYLFNQTIDCICDNLAKMQEQINALSGGGSLVTADSVTTFTNKSGNISQWTNNVNYVIGDGNTNQYLRGNGSKATFPTIPTNVDYVDRTTNQSIDGNKTFTGTTTFNDLITSRGMIPDGNTTRDLGSPTLRWNTGYISILNSNGAMRIRLGNTGSSIMFSQVNDSNSFATFFGNGGNLLLQPPGTIGADDGNRLQVIGSIISTQYKLSALNTAPASATAPGTTGEIRWANGFVYLCVATNTWQRGPLATWP